MLKASFDDQRAIFAKQESLGSVTRWLDTNTPIHIYEGQNAYIPGLQNQLEAASFSVATNLDTDQLQFELDPQTGSYIVVSEDNFRMTLSLPPLAKKTNSWVLIVNEENVELVQSRLSNANSVLAVGNFRRDILQQIEGSFTEWINNNNVFLDSEEIAKKQAPLKNIILTDGIAIEDEFFRNKNAVLLSGKNKILDETFDFLMENQVENVVIVGNQLAVVGEQIRQNSDKKIAVFVKYGQSDAKNPGRTQALSYFSLPAPTIGINITDVVYDAQKQQLVAYFTNVGNIGAYALTTLTINDENGQEIANDADKEVQS